MFNFGFRIGTKLAASAGIGVILVVGLVVNEQLVNRTIEQLNADSRDTGALVENVLAADVALGEIKAADQALRVAGSAEAVNDPVSRVGIANKIGTQKLESAYAGALTEADREHLSRAKDLFARYVKAVQDLSGARTQFQASRAQEDREVAIWEQALDQVFKNPFLIALGNRRDVERLLHSANSAFKDAQIASWRFRATSDNAQRIQVSDNLEAMEKRLKDTRDIVAEPALVTDIEELVAKAPGFREVATTALTAADELQRVARDEVDPLPRQIDDHVAAVRDASSKRSAEIRVDTAAAISRSRLIGLAIGSAVILILVGSAIFAVFVIARPVRRIGEVLVDLANGNKAVEIPYADRRDEVGDNARAAKTFKDNLLRMEHLEAEQRQVEARAVDARKTAMYTLADGFEAAVGRVVEAVSSASTELEAAANTLTNTADTTQQLSGVVAGASEDASANVRSVAAATEELTGSVAEISRQVHESSRIAGDAVHQAEHTDTRITALSKAASRIGDVVQLITAIAEQTNLLALNATIEAARAGEAGRGFAVVAQEVKALAAQTAKATDEIGGQIAAMQTATQDSVGAIKEISATIRRISHISTAIAAAVEQQGTTTQEIARNVQQAAQGTAQVATNIGDVNRAAGETGSASSQVLTSAKALSNEGNKLKLEVGKFLATIRAA